MSHPIHKHALDIGRLSTETTHTMSKVRVLYSSEHPYGLVEVDGQSIAARSVDVKLKVNSVPTVTIELDAFDLEVETHNSEVTTTPTPVRPQ